MIISGSLKKTTPYDGYYDSLKPGDTGFITAAMALMSDSSQVLECRYQLHLKGEALIKKLDMVHGNFLSGSNQTLPEGLSFYDLESKTGFEVEFSVRGPELRSTSP